MRNHSTGDSFVDLEIHILPDQEEGYPVEITLGGQQEFQGQLSADIAFWVPSGDPEKDGQSLFDLLFTASELRRAWERALGQAEALGGASQRRIRLHIDQDAAELHALPWELLRERGTVSATLSTRQDTPFSRYLASSSPWRDPLRERPVRVLVAISNPDDLAKYNLAPVDVAAEREALESTFQAAGEEELRADFLAAPVTLEQLGEKLLDDYHVLHFVGHGAFNARRGQTALYVQDQAGHAKRVLDDQLAELLARQGRQLRLVFLAACQSATRSESDAFQGLSPKLVAAGIPAVVAMQDVVTIETARKFSAVFYRRLLEHYQVDLAANEARGALLDAARPDAAVPVLFMRLKNGRLLERTPLPGAPQTDSERLRLEVKSPGQAYLNRPFYLYFTLSPLTWPILEQGGSTGVRAADAPVHLEARIKAPGCEIHGSDSYSFHFYPSDDPALYAQRKGHADGRGGAQLLYVNDNWSGSWRLNPRKLGQLDVVIDVYQGDHLLVSQSTSIAVYDIGNLPRNIHQHLSTEDIRSLCFGLGIDYEDLGTRGKQGQATELVMHCQRHRKIPELLAQCQQLRPDVNW